MTGNKIDACAYTKNKRVFIIYSILNEQGFVITIVGVRDPEEGDAMDFS